MTCEEIRTVLDEALDERTPELAAAVVDHLEGCSRCRERWSELEALSGLLRDRPRVALPAEALDDVWRRTIQAGVDDPRTRAGFRRLAAAVLATAVVGTTLYFVFAPPARHAPTAAELARAEAQADLVLGYAARALAATRTAATDRVLASKVSPAVRGIAASHPARRSR